MWADWIDAGDLAPDELLQVQRQRNPGSPAADADCFTPDARLSLAVPGLHGVATEVTHMKAEWLIVAVVLEILSCLGYVLAFLQVFDRAPIRFGARVALSELAFGAAVSLGRPFSVVSGSDIRCRVDVNAPTSSRLRGRCPMPMNIHGRLSFW